MGDAAGLGLFVGDFEPGECGFGLPPGLLLGLAAALARHRHCGRQHQQHGGDRAMPPLFIRTVTSESHLPHAQVRAHTIPTVITGTAAALQEKVLNEHAHNIQIAADRDSEDSETPPSGTRTAQERPRRKVLLVHCVSLE